MYYTIGNVLFFQKLNKLCVCHENMIKLANVRRAVFDTLRVIFAQNNETGTDHFY